MSRSILPNFFSALRIALMPAALLVAVGGSRPWFIGLVSVALLTDALDGFFARRLNAFSEFEVHLIDSDPRFLAPPRPEYCRLSK